MARTDGEREAHGETTMLDAITLRPGPAARVYRICFVCTGNICRSPIAEAVFRDRIADAGLHAQVEVSSAGTGGWHSGEEADRRAVAALEAAGYPCDHVARQFHARWFERLDLVVALDTGHHEELRALAPTADDAAKVRLLRSFDPAAGDELDVADPYFGPDEGFETCLEQVEAAVPGLLEAVREALGTPDGPRTPAEER